jgi:hypothetical protein
MEGAFVPVEPTTGLRPAARFDLGRSGRFSSDEGCPSFRATLHRRRTSPMTTSEPNPVPLHPATLDPALEGRVLSPAGDSYYRVRCTTLSVGGMYVSSSRAPPPLLSDVRIVLELHGTFLECRCEVVRHVAVEQAARWGMPEGFAVQFVDTHPGFQRTLHHLVDELRTGGVGGGTKPAHDDRLADEALRAYRRGPYAHPEQVLGLPKGADLNEVRRAAKDARRHLEELKQRPLSATQRRQVHQAIEQVVQALLALCRERHATA